MLLHQRFIKTAKQFGDKLAIVDRHSNRRLTYSNALIATLILAEKFKAYDPGFIGIMIPNSAGSALAILGTVMSGRTPVMINYSTGAAANVEYAQKKCAFRTVLTSKALLEKIKCPVLPGMVFLEDIMERITSGEKINAAMKSKLPSFILRRMIHQGDIEDTVAVLFTSGSEKEPRAVQLSHRNIGSNIRSIFKAIEFSDHDNMLANLPYFHVFGLTVNFWLPILSGMTLVTYTNPLDFKAICDAVREEKVTLMVGTPTILAGYLRKSETGDFQSLRVLISGADKCPHSLRDGFLEKHRIPLLEGYGATETSPVITVNTPRYNRPGSVGKVLPNVRVLIENCQTGKECRPGETGKILVKGDLVMKGYFDDFEETCLHIRQGWYDTGDMGYLDRDGYLWHVGRLRRFIKIGGEMISLVRVEDALETLLPPETSCCVVEIPDAVKGAKIIAVVTQAVNDKEILKKMSEQLPNIALPRQFVIMEDLPKMGSGKIDFRTITERVRDMLAVK